MGIKTYQEKNAKPIEKELAQSDIPVKRKIHISGKWYLRDGGGKSELNRVKIKQM